MFIAMSIQDFDMEPSPNNLLKFPFPIKVEAGKMIGFLPVYETREAALSEYPDCQILEARLVRSNDD